MDAPTLSALIDASSQELEELHKRLGCPPSELERAMEDLKTSIRDAIRAQVREVEARVADVQKVCDMHHERIQALCRVTGATSMCRATSSDALLAQRDALAEEEARMNAVYERQCEQCDAILAQISALNECMSDAGGPAPLPPSVEALRDVTPAALQRLEAHSQHVQDTYKARKVQMEAHISEIVQLWAELRERPLVDVQGGRAVPQRGPDDAAFHGAVLQYVQQVPVFLADGTFAGEFAPATSAAAADGDAAEPGDLLQPTDDVLRRAAAMQASLEAEKTQRESRIQAYYDELCELWMRFDVPETEMDAFVLDHRGSTLDVVDAYRTELDKMRALKSQHMSLFLQRTRDQIWEQWEALYMSERERETSFPAFFVPLPDEEGAPFDWDALLAQHEHMYTKLCETLEQRAPLLQLIGRYRAICDEERALEESAQDGTRLLGRGNRGDPGRLLREEKMRKRVKVQKPKLEQELLKVLPAWEAEHRMPFLMDGVRFVDYLRDQLGGAKENPRAPRRAAPAGHVDRLATSRSANHAAEPAPRGARAAPTKPAGVRRGPGPAAAPRPRVASQSRTAPYAATPSARSRAGSSMASTSWGTSDAPSCSTPAVRPPGAAARAATPETDVSYSAADRTPSAYLASSLLRAPASAVPRW